MAGLPVAALGSLRSDNFVSVSKISAKRVATPRPPATASTSARARFDLRAVSGLAGQAGYIHFFVITGPDNEPETQIGIELADGRIAWSFPEAGVSVSPFPASGTVMVGSTQYQIEHLYGLKPFRDEASMVALRRELPARMAPYVEENTPYCDESGDSARFCMSCLGFVLRVIYPGTSRGFPALPGDFRSAQGGRYSTEDLLLYLAGVPLNASRTARARRIQALAVPDSLREELTRISSSLETGSDTPTAKPRRRAAAKSPADLTRRASGRRS
ncbi:MAG: hypothetical protein ACXW2A_09590 [Burkholderiales bacterium]